MVATIAGITITWNGGPGDWNDFFNWDLGVVPTIDDDVIIGATAAVTIAAAANANTLTLAGFASITQTAGLLTIAGNAQLDGDLTLSNSTISVAGVLTSTATVSLLDSTVNAGNWDNQGTLHFTRIGDASVNDNDSFINTTTFTNPGLIEIDFANSNTGGNTNATFANGFTNDGVIRYIGETDTGTLIVTSGTLINSATGSIESPAAATGLRELDATLTNLGLIDIDRDLRITNNSGRIFDTTAGTINILAGFNLFVDGGTTTLGGATTLQ